MVNEAFAGNSVVQDVAMKECTDLLEGGVSVRGIMSVIRCKHLSILGEVGVHNVFVMATNLIIARDLERSIRVRQRASELLRELDGNADNNFRQLHY